MRIIDADELKLKLKWLEVDKPVCHDVMSTIDEIATVEVVAKNETATEVVRCKDCKYMTEHYDTDGNVPYWTCSEWDSGTDYDGYCHYGERREDER